MSAPLPSQWVIFPSGVDAADPMVALVGDVHVAIGCRGDARWRPQLGRVARPAVAAVAGGARGAAREDGHLPLVARFQTRCFEGSVM